jgi:hypothetical protein
MQFHGFVLWRFEGDKTAERWATVTPPALNHRRALSFAAIDYVLLWVSSAGSDGRMTSRPSMRKS